MAPYTGPSPPVDPPENPTPPLEPGSIKVDVAGVMFTDTAARGDYNPLYDRQRELNIEPPQWQIDPPKNEPISYVRRGCGTVKLDISGSSRIPEESSLWVKVIPSGRFTSDSTSITFTPESRTVRVTDWSHLDYDDLSFTTSAFPNEVRLDALEVTWRFEYRYPDGDTWYSGGEEKTLHETYLTYARPYYKFAPFYRPWKQVLRTACSYAHGATSTISASTGVTTRIYDSLEFNYRSNESHSSFFDNSIQLWDMIGEGWMDCMDGSNYYTILMRWLGIPAHQKKIDRAPFHRFVYNLLRPISRSPRTEEGWESEIWNFHQVGILTHVYDPIIKVNRTEKADGTVEGTVPTNMTEAAYKRAIFERGDFVWDALKLVKNVY